ncbi:hypothetical protein RSOL_355110 [Rhizoctonia solani AG-3 Rhs1AP]|uniref:Uncharacterized protein n=1 Tax=Rhizoctonia solani AG-3 Rhs1AP TaxID=1086054 RepID=X8J980_9AGAM|nr:hypothetical protein RSOL_355110 [Rhizoctonia solani AG-3 Rhs1AP]
MRSGRVYNPGHVLETPKRRTRKSKTSEQPVAPQTPTAHVSKTTGASGDSGLTPAEEPAEDSLVLQGKGEGKSVTWTADEAVR